MGGTFDELEAGYAVARHHLKGSPDSGRSRGTVEALAVAPAAEAPMQLADEAAAHAGRGLEGDRYFDHRRDVLQPSFQWGTT